MLKGRKDELDYVDEHISHIVFSMCSSCRFMAGLRVIGGMDDSEVEQLIEYAHYKIKGIVVPWSGVEPRHRRGGCYVRIRS